VFATPVFVTTDNLSFEMGLVQANTSVVSVTGLWFNISLALY
jgi:hypothetical protein